jgi:hypothetical protein
VDQTYEVLRGDDELTNIAQMGAAVDGVIKQTAGKIYHLERAITRTGALASQLSFRGSELDANSWRQMLANAGDDDVPEAAKANRPAGQQQDQGSISSMLKTLFKS